MSINNLNTYLNIKDSHLRVVSGNVYAQAMNIGGINIETAHGLQSVSNTGNVTSNTIQFSNAITGFVTTANAQIGRDLIVSGNATVSTDLTVSANATVADTLTISEHLIASKEATVTGNLHVTTIRSDSNVVTEYTGPHDRPLRKYPEVAMTADAATSSGYKGYKVEKSSDQSQSNLDAWRIFDGVKSVANGWASQDGTYYDGSSPANSYTGTTHQLGTGTVYGEWLKLELPNKIKVSKFTLYADPGVTGADTWGINEAPKSYKIYGSVTGLSWTELKDVSNETPSTSGNSHNITDNTAYRYLGIVVTQVNTDQDNIRIGELEYYGYEEGSASLDTTLKSVYNVPATTGTQLEVYYDAKGESTVQSPIPDLSPNTNTGAVSGHSPTLDSTDGIDSFKFNGSSQYINAGNIGVTAGSGEYPHSMSAWIKIDTLTSTMALTQIGSNPVSAGTTSIFYINTLGNIILDISGGSNTEWYSGLLTNQWYHVSYTYNGGASGRTPTSYKLYINGVDQGHQDTGAGSGTLNLASGSTLAIGHRFAGNFFDGSVANFRHYSKILNADQVKELYDYQKDYFLGSKSQLTIYKGHLGVGVTEPSGQLELAGDERLQEYPPGPMSNYETLIPGHGVFCASMSNPNTGGKDAWKAFNKVTGNTDHIEHAYTPSYQYGANDGNTLNSFANPTNIPYNTNGVVGLWIQLELPYEINLKRYSLTARSTSTLQASRMPEQGVLFGSNDGVTWTAIHNHNDTAGRYTSGIGPRYFSVDDTYTYRYFRLVTTKLFQLGSTSGNERPDISELKFFGTPGPTTLDKGSLTLGRSLDVPRVSRYDVDTETPRPEKLFIDFDTTVNSSPTDISGKGNHGKFVGTNMNYSSADKAFVFNGTDDYMYLEQNVISGTSATHTFSLWINALSGPGNGSYEAIFEGGVRSNNQAFGLYAYQDGSNTRVYYHVFGNNLPSNTAGYIVNTNSWYHICGTLDNSGNVRRFYINGELFASDTYGSLNVTHPRIRIGENVNGSESWHGMVSNFKLYNVALEPSEVKKLYNLGRTGRSMVISDTAVGIGKVPEAQLDVRGNIKCDVIMPRTIAFSAYASSGGDSSTTGVWPGNVTLYNFGNAYDTSTYRFTAPVNGVYHFEWSSFTNTGGTATSRIFLKKNGNNEAQKGNSIERHGNGISISIYLDAGEYITISGSSSYPLYYYGAGGHNHFSGYLVHATQ